MRERRIRQTHAGVSELFENRERGMFRRVDHRIPTGVHRRL